MKFLVDIDAVVDKVTSVKTLLCQLQNLKTLKLNNKLAETWWRLGEGMVVLLVS